MKKLATLLAFLLIPSVALSATDRYVAIYPTGSTNPSGYSATYTSMATMEAGEDGDLTAAGGTRLRVEITASDGTWAYKPDTTQVTWDGWTCDYSSGEYILINTVDNAKPSSQMFWDETAYIFGPNATNLGMNIDNDHAAVPIAIEFQDVQFYHAVLGTWGPNIAVAAASYIERLNLTRCWVWNDQAGAGGSGVAINDVAAVLGSEIHIVNSVLVGGERDGVHIDAASGNAPDIYIVNSTFMGWQTDAISSNGQADIYPINCALFYNVDDFQDAFPAGYPLRCASDQGAGEGTNGIDLTPGVQATDLAVTFEQPAKSTNLLANGGFETCAGCTANDGVTDNFANWTESDGGGYIDLDTNEAVIPEGTNVVNIYKNGATASIRQDVTLVANTKYVFSYVGKSDGTAACTPRIISGSDDLQDDGSWAAVANYDLNPVIVSSSETAWTYKSFVFTSHPTGTTHTIYLKTSTANLSGVWVDDVKVYAWPRVDFRLTGTTTTANLVNAGVSHTLVPKVDIVGVSREGRPDIGAFEYAAGNFWQRFLYFFRRR